MKVLLLGGNGLLGHNVLKQLLQQGHEIHALLRSSLDRDASKWQGMSERVTLYQGSLLDDVALQAAAEGCDAIINCAGVTDMSLLRYEDYLSVNRDLCHRLVLLMERLHITRLVHTSTANTIGFGTPSQSANEQSQMQAPFSRSYYGLSKREGEEILLEAVRKHPEWHIVIVNPGFMVGAYDTKPSSGVLLLTGYRKLLMVAPRGGKSFVHVSDAAVAVANALECGQNGHRYLLTGENLTLKEFYQLQAKVCGYRQWIVPLPNTVLAVAGWCGDLLRLCGLRMQVSTRNVRQLMVREYYDNAAAHAELIMPQTPIEQAVSDFFEWYQSHAVQK